MISRQGKRGPAGCSNARMTVTLVTMATAAEQHLLMLLCTYCVPGLLKALVFNPFERK